jgi:hypothetical protein
MICTLAARLSVAVRKKRNAGILPYLTFAAGKDPCYDAECGTREALTDLSSRDTSEEIRAHEPEAVPTLIHTQQTKDRFLRGFSEPTESWGGLIDLDGARRVPA